MSRSLMTLAIAALDDLARILTLQQLLEISLEQFDDPTEKTEQRVDMLLSCYLSQVEPHFEDLKFSLERIREQLGYHPPD